MGEDRLEPGSPAWSKRQRVHTHNGFKGHARMMMMQAKQIMDADSSTEETKSIARTIYNCAFALSESLQERVDRD